ncbi:cell division protein FtsZ [Candidatus Poribacteria bacterium]|nr:cell division protein FtsZ [Candidatus Poribacteria bacterium]
MLEFEERKSGPAVIRVVGVGGAGGNAVNTMMDAGLQNVEFYVVNTDIQDLGKCNAPTKIQIGESTTNGLGAGSDPQMGQQSAKDDKEKLQELVVGADMLFITAGMGGGTGTGASPVIAEIGKDAGVLTVAVVTKPFDFEGRVRAAQAADGIKELKNFVDALITIPNQKLLDVVDRNVSLIEAFKIANDVLRQGVQSISDLITGVGYISVDFADVRTVMSETGSALMGIGIGDGENRAEKATEKAISNPLVEEASIEGARGVLVNISGSSDLRMHEIHEAMNPIHEAVSPDAIILFGVVIDEDLGEKIKTTVIATGFDTIRNNPEMMDADGIDMDAILNRNFDRPTFLRKKRQSNMRGSVGNNRTNDMSGDNLDIPAFLRSSRKIEE